MTETLDTICIQKHTFMLFVKPWFWTTLHGFALILRLRGSGHRVKATRKLRQETSYESSQKKPPKISCLTKNLEIDLPKCRPKVPQNHSKSNPGPPGDPKMALLATIGSPGGFGTKFGAQSGHTMHPPGPQSHRKSLFRHHVFSFVYLAPTIINQATAKVEADEKELCHEITQPEIDH